MAAPSSNLNGVASSSNLNDVASSSKAKANGAETVFALIIGINEYQATDDFSTLQGAVNDAQAFERYLLDPREKQGLAVPADNIVVLLDDKATRENILATFLSHFLNNRKIPDGGKTTMILFFAGHGTRIKAPDNLISHDGRVESICPVDERTTDASGKYVHTIPDYVLGWLLWELAAKKGPNITLIFDSCHAGGMGRDEGMGRNANSPSPSVPLDLDSHLWRGKTKTVQSYRMWAQAATSHVLLAACREDETAREIRHDHDKSVHGRFTDFLIRRLREAHLENTTYAELLNLLPTWSGQTPHCGGSKRDRLVFSGNYPATGRRALPLILNTTVDSKNPDTVKSFRVEMGSVEGVVNGTEFVVERPDKTVLCTLVAQSVRIHQAILVMKDRKAVDLPPMPRVVVSDWKNDAMIMRVCTAADFPFTSDLFPTTNFTRQQHKRRFVQAPAPAKADILIRTAASDSEQIVIERLTSTMLGAQRETRFSLKGNTAHLPLVVDGIAHFNYFLERHHGSAPLEGFALEMHRLTGEYPGRKPDPTVGRDGNMIDLHEARFLSQKDAKYGFTVRNTSSEDLFPYLFYFDPVKYTINSWYAPAGMHVKPPLPARGGALTIGMGGERAFEFTLPPGESESSGFLKLFVSTQYLELGWIQQPVSPFDPKYEGTPRLDGTREPMADVERWDALSVLLTMTDTE
ncbi:caspase domain-containing protein [Mycena epipterygia]|nr:caspase domain-containing protein [Mycena epipterygia]